MAATPKVSPEAVLDAVKAQPGVTAAEVAETLGMGQSTATKHLAALEARKVLRRQPGGRDGNRRLPDRWHVSKARAKRAGKSADRLGRGALGALVHEYLAARPDQDLGPTQVGKGLGRSQGAVSNALARLEANGQVRLVTKSPRRYRVADR